MNDKSKYPKDKGKPIGVKRAKAEQNRWKNNPKNGKYPSDTFAVPFELLTASISNPVCTGVKFCNGLDENGGYNPVICAVDENGVILSAFDEKGDISESEFDNCRKNWEKKFPEIEGNAQFFYLGEEAIKENIESFDVERYEAAFVEKRNGDDSALLYGYSIGGMKDPGDDDPDTALNDTYFCPPWCEGEGN